MRLPPLLVLLIVALLGGVGTAAAQIDEKPPVIRRAPKSTADRGSTDSSGKKEPETITASGVVRHIDEKKVEVLIEDGRIFTAAIDSKTAFIGPEGKIAADRVTHGTHVRISVKANQDLDLTATSIVLEKAPDPKSEAAAETDSAARPEAAKPPPTVKPEDDVATMKTEDTDPDRPVLKRGMPKKAPPKDEDASEEPVPAPAPTAAETAAPKPPEEAPSLVDSLKGENQNDLLKKAREANLAFIAHLPNFVCQQYTTRYERINKLDGWKANDIISATVVYESGKERYDNIKINNRAANADMMGIKGARSVGEFGSSLSGLFSSNVRAEFHYDHAESFRRAHAKVFSFSVKRENTDWTIAIGGQSIEPAYSGRIWIDSESGRVLRIERQADEVPESFPLVVTEQTVDYDSVMLGGRKLLLPVESVNLSCERGTSFCSKNVIQFRDYKEFRGESTVTFDK